MLEASTASMILSLFTSEATVCIRVKSEKAPMESFAYAERTADASAASIKLSPLTSPSLIVTTEAELSLLSAAVSLTFFVCTYVVCKVSAAA